MLILVIVHTYKRINFFRIIQIQHIQSTVLSVFIHQIQKSQRCVYSVFAHARILIFPQSHCIFDKAIQNIAIRNTVCQIKICSINRKILLPVCRSLCLSFLLCILWFLLRSSSGHLNGIGLFHTIFRLHDDLHFIYTSFQFVCPTDRDHRCLSIIWLCADCQRCHLISHFCLIFGNFRLKFRRKGSFGNRQGCQRIVFWFVICHCRIFNSYRYTCTSHIHAVPFLIARRWCGCGKTCSSRRICFKFNSSACTFVSGTVTPQSHRNRACIYTGFRCCWLISKKIFGICQIYRSRHPCRKCHCHCLFSRIWRLKQWSCSPPVHAHPVSWYNWSEIPVPVPLPVSVFLLLCFFVSYVLPFFYCPMVIFPWRCLFRYTRSSTLTPSFLRFVSAALR